MGLVFGAGDVSAFMRALYSAADKTRQKPQRLLLQAAFQIYQNRAFPAAGRIALCFITKMRIGASKTAIIYRATSCRARKSRPDSGNAAGCFSLLLPPAAPSGCRRSCAWLFSSFYSFTAGLALLAVLPPGSDKKDAGRLALWGHVGRKPNGQKR